MANASGDKNPLLVRIGQPLSRTGDRPPRAVEREEQTPEVAHSHSHSPPSTEQDQPNRSMHHIASLSNMHREMTAVGCVIIITKQSTYRSYSVLF